MFKKTVFLNKILKQHLIQKQHRLYESLGQYLPITVACACFLCSKILQSSYNTKSTLFSKLCIILVSCPAGSVPLKHIRCKFDDQKDNKRILSTHTFRQLFHEGKYTYTYKNVDRQVPILNPSTYFQYTIVLAVLYIRMRNLTKL